MSQYFNCFDGILTEKLMVKKIITPIPFHYGSSTASTMEFLQAVTPAHAVISMGKDNAWCLCGSAFLRIKRAVPAALPCQKSYLVLSGFNRSAGLRLSPFRESLQFLFRQFQRQAHNRQVVHIADDRNFV